MSVFPKIFFKSPLCPRAPLQKLRSERFYACEFKHFALVIRPKSAKIILTARRGLLDLANDMSDNNVSIRPTADFDSYRAEEVEWLKSQPDFEALAADGIDRVFALCHMPYIECEGKSYEKYALQFASESERLGVQLLLSAHRHKTLVIDANELSYPCIIGGKRSDSLDVDETIFASAFTGTAIEIKDDGVYMSFVNSKCETLLSRKIV